MMSSGFMVPEADIIQWRRQISAALGHSPDQNQGGGAAAGCPGGQDRCVPTWMRFLCRKRLARPLHTRYPTTTSLPGP
jgi:hypothetical protein